MSDSSESAAPPPRANPNFIGHPAAEQTLLRAWQSNRLHHAWLISGPRGVGKATLAFRFARHALAGEERGLFAEPASTLAMAAESPVFRHVAAGSHPDLLTIERAYDEKRDRFRTEIVVDDVRELGAFLHLKAAAGGWRVVVVDCADDLNPSAANALLKLLEEPPAKALLLLVSHAPGRLLPTIRSRCRRLTLAPLDTQAMDEFLQTSCPQLADADRRLLIQLADGSIGRALEIAGTGGLDLYRDIAGQLRQLPKFDAVALHALGDRLGHRDAGDLFRLATEILLGWLGRAVRLAATGQGSPGSIGGEGAPALSLGRHSLEQWLELWEKITRLFARVESANLDRKQVWVGAMLDIAGLASR
ncbi:MAG: DNA polymerase III subunit delta' [Gemmataceae bacterium]|nr:DNA polymerase III subunit delta' [Gemmataceae bacterium]